MKAPDEEMTKGAEKPINITSSSSELSEECSREEMIEEVGILGDDAETAPATLMTAETGSMGILLANVSARDLVTTAGDNSLGFRSTLQGKVDDNMELLDSSVMSQLTKPEHEVYKETMMLEKSATDETGVDELQISNAEPNSSEQYAHHIHESDEISTMKSSEMHICEEVTNVEALAEGDNVPNLTHAAGHLIKQFQGPSSATTAEKVEDEIPMEKETLVNELELELVEDKWIDGSGESPTEEPTYLKEAASEEPQEYISIIQSAESSSGGQEELEDIRHFSSLEPSKEDTLDSAELNKEKELETVGENENITNEGKAAEDPYRDSNREGADNNSCSQEADGRNVEEAPTRLDHSETKAPNEENVESHEEPRSASISKVDEQLNGTTSVPKKVDADENSINDEGKLDSTEIKVSEQNSNDVEIEMSNEAALENKINTREDCIETLKDVIFLKEIEQVTVEKSEDIKGQICEQDTCTQELQKTTSSHEVLNETTYSDPVPIVKLEATNLSPEMKQGTEKPVNSSRSVLEGSEEDNGEEKIKEAAIVNGITDTPPATLVSETSSEDVQLGEKFMKDSDTENQIEKATEVNETAEDTLISEDDKVGKSFLGTNSIPIEDLSEGLGRVDAQETGEHVKGIGNAIVNSNQDSVAKGTVNESLPQQTTDKKNVEETPYETDQIEIEAETTILSEEIAYLDPVPNEYREARDLNVETEREKLRTAEYLKWESEASSIAKSPEKEAKKSTEKPADITSSVIDVPAEKSRELKSEADIFNASTDTRPGTLVMLLSLEEVQQGEMLIKESDMKSTDENLNIKMTHTSQEDEEVDRLKLEETFVGKEIVTADNPAKEDEAEEIFSDTVSTSIEQDPKDVLDMDKVQHELTEVPEFIDEEVIQDFMATDSIPIQELSEELQRVDVQEKAEEHVTSAGSAVVEFYQESDRKGTVNENLAQETNEEKTINENPSDLEQQEMGEEAECAQINAKTTVPTEEIAYSDPVPTGYPEALDLNVHTEREELRDEDLNWESEASSITKPPENEKKKCTEKPVDITSSVIDVPEEKSRELKSETDAFSASTATPPGTPVMETSLEEVQQGETLIKGSDMKSTDENLNIKMTHTSQEDEKVDSMKLEETLSGRDIVFAEKQNANEGEPEEIETSDTISTSIEQDPKDVLDMDKVKHELTEVPKFITESKEVTKDFMVTNSILIQELSEELQRVDAEENSEEHVTGAGMPGSAVVDIYQESVAEGTANENLAQETNEEKAVMETPCDLELQETGEEPEHMEINAETAVLSEEIAYSDTVPTGYLEAIDLNVETAREELKGAEDLNWESKASSITKPPEIEEKKGIEKPVDITISVIDVPGKKSRELKSETDIFNASTATPPGTLVMERSLEEVQQGETLIKGSDMKSTDENVNTKMTHAYQEDEEVDSVKLEETFVVKEIVIAEKPAAHKDEAEQILTSDTVSTSIEQNPQDVLDMDNVQHESTEVPGFVAEDKEVTKDFMATDSFPIQEVSEELQRVDVQEKAEEHVTGARSAVMDFHQESVAKGTANESFAQETNEENIVEAPSDLELQATVEEPECIEINAETAVLTEENLEAVEPHDELLSAHEYVADGQIDEPIPQTNKSNRKDRNDQNLESTIEKIIEQDYLEDQSEMNEYVEHKFGETQGGHETTKDLILVEKAVVDIQKVEETGDIKGDIMEEACYIQELKRISESDEKTSKKINSEPIPIDSLEAIGSITDTEEVKLLTSENLSWNSGSPFATDAPEEDKKQGIENTSCDISSEFEESEKMVKEESMEKADADNKESENLNNPDADESEVDKSMHLISGLADLATNLTEKVHEPLSEMLHKEQAVETTTTTENLEDESLQKDATLLNECVEDTLSTRTIDAALLQKETPKGLQVSPPGFEIDAVKQNESPNEAATDEWTVVEEAAAVEPQEDVYKMKTEDSLIPSSTHIPGNAFENFNEDPIQDFQKAEKVLESTSEAQLSAVTKSKVAEIEEEHHKRAMTARIDGEIQNEITDETTGTIKKEILSEKTTLDEEVVKDSLVVSTDEEKIRSSYNKDELETLEYPEEITSQKLETTKIATHAEESDPTTDIEEQTLAESTPVKEVHQDFLGGRTVIVIHPEEINDEKNVKGVPTIINLQEESYETNSRDTNTEDTTIITEVNISEVELLKHVEDRAHSVEKNNLTPNYEAQSTPEASANKNVGEAEDVFAIAQNHPAQEIIEVHGANTNTEKEDNNIPDCHADAEKPEHTPAESTFDRNIGTGSLNQREQEKAKEYLAISHKDGTVDLTVAIDMALGVQMLEKTYVSMSDKQIMTEADSDESSKPEVSTGSKDDPLKREDLITKTLDAEVGNLRAENDSKPELESKSADTGEETIMIDEVKEQTEKPESTMISLSELLSRSTKGTSQVAKRLIEESETTDKKGLQADKVDSDEDEGAKEEEEGGENQKADSGSDAPVMVEASRDMDVKVCKKSHGILSGVGSKVKHSISKVKKVITGKSSHPKQSSPDKGIQ